MIQSNIYVTSTDHVTKPIIDFCLSPNHACAVFDTYRAKCWGKGSNFGSLSDYGSSSLTIGDGIPYFNPGTNLLITKVTCGYDATCFLLNTGGIKCIGGNQYGQIGIGNTSNPIGVTSGHIGDTLPVVDLGNGLFATSFASGFGHHCILVTGNKIKCYGQSSNGQLGLGDKTARGRSPSDMGDSLPYTDLGTNVEVVSIHSGPSSYHNCVVLLAPPAVAQRIKCWGANYSSQLGYGDTSLKGDSLYEMGDNLTLVDLGTESRVTQLALGEQHTCALLISSTLKCFGQGSYGQLASGALATVSSTGNSMPSVPIDSGKTVKFVTAGTFYTCVVYDDMLTMKCTGYNSRAQLGQGDKLQRGETPSTMIPNITAIDLGTETLKISSIISGSQSNCVIFIDNSVKCFGDNTFGILAIGSTAVMGDQQSDMGINLPYAMLFSPTVSPTLSPTRVPTNNPSRKPSTNPTHHPTYLPTRQCDYQSAKLCKYDVKCMWKKVDNVKQCVAFDCAGLIKGKCVKERTKCRWDKKTSLCEPKKK